MSLRHPCPRCMHVVRSGQKCVCGFGGNSTAERFGSGWSSVALRVVAEERHCRACGHPGSPDNPLTADHIVPRARGGGNDRANLQCLCRRCNSAKAAGGG